VDLDGIDGLIHISELSWSHVNHPWEVVAIGDTVRIKVLDIDRDRQWISLCLKQTQEDPWQRVISTHRPGDVLEGTVTKVVAFGAFVEILPGVEGLVHISELADHHVENPSEVVEPGAKLNVKILEIDEDRRRLSLSIKRVENQNMPMLDLSAQIAAANAAQAGVAEDAAEEAAIDVAEDSPVEGQEVESPAVEAETAAAEVPEGATAEAAVEDAAQAEAPEAAPEAATSEPEAVAEAPAAESSEPEAGSEGDGADDAASGGDTDSESEQQG
ncbi:MAG: S1 RNA-binding domain-containing protein, partial [Actinobacteria bacterium]|nr:S1 RNA-binding domain-containing protein [Actinomycetota bacterium]